MEFSRIYDLMRYSDHCDFKKTERFKTDREKYVLELEKGLKLSRSDQTHTDDYIKLLDKIKTPDNKVTEDIDVPSDLQIIINEHMLDDYNNKIAIRLLTKEQQKKLLEIGYKIVDDSFQKKFNP